MGAAPFELARSRFYHLTNAPKARGMLTMVAVMRRFTCYAINLHWSPAMSQSGTAVVQNKTHIK